MTTDDVSFLKNGLTDRLEQAGYDPVSLTKKRGVAETEFDIAVEKYEESGKNETGCFVASGSCAYLCPCVAPCFLFPRYFTVRFDLVTNVKAYRKGRLLFSGRFAEEGESPANVLDAGTEPMKKSLREVAINNTVARIMGAVNKQ